ncbi:MAG TPA: tetratricopeptide repeat protein [bacterium]
MKTNLLVLILMGLACGLLISCGSTQYAAVKRYISHEDFTRAQTELEATGPSDAQGWALLAECRLLQQDYLGLADAAHRSLALSDEFRGEINHFLQLAFIEQLNSGILAFNDGNDPEASRLFNQLLVYSQAIREYMTPQMVKTSQRVAGLAGAVSIRLKNFPSARAYLEGLRSQWKSNPALLERVAFIYFQMGEPQLCVATCESLLVREPKNTTVLELRTQACQQLGHADATVNAYRDALELSPDSIIIHRNIGIILFQLEEWKEARSHLAIAFHNKPADSLSLLVMMSECLYNEGDYEGALQGFKRAAEGEGGSPDLYKAMGACYRCLGDRKQADVAFREATRVAGRNRTSAALDSAGISPGDLQRIGRDGK